MTLQSLGLRERVDLDRDKSFRDLTGPEDGIWNPQENVLSLRIGGTLYQLKNRLHEACAHLPKAWKPSRDRASPLALLLAVSQTPR